MRKPVFFLGTALTVAIAIFFIRHFEVRWGESFEIRPRPSSSSVPDSAVVTKVAKQAAHQGSGTLRVASFQVDPWDPARWRRSEDVVQLAQITQRYDVISLSGIRLEGPKPLIPLLDQVRQQGGDFEAITGPVSGQPHDTHRFVVLYNRRTVQAGQQETYVVPHTAQVFRYPPLVTCFRALGPKSDVAFTFSLVSVYIDPQQADNEISMIATLLSNVQNDGRGEDDVIVAGTFQDGGLQLRRAWDASRIAPLLREEGQPFMTNTDRSLQLDNLVVDTWASTEFTGRFGVFDFMREWNLKLEEARRFSPHLPVWAEFALQEEDLHLVH